MVCIYFLANNFACLIFKIWNLLVSLVRLRLHYLITLKIGGKSGVPESAEN